MFISHTTQRGTEFKAHATRKEAVAYLLDNVGGDYAKDFWVSDDGERIIENGHSRLGFSLVVYNSTKEAIEDQKYLHGESLPETLHSLADAIQAGIEAGL